MIPAALFALACLAALCVGLAGLLMGRTDVAWIVALGVAVPALSWFGWEVLQAARRARRHERMAADVAGRI